MLRYLALYLCKLGHKISEYMKKASYEAYGKDIRDKMHSIGNIFLTKSEIFTYETTKKILSLSMRQSNIDVLFAPTGLKN